MNLYLGAGFVLACILGMIVLPNILFVSHKKQLFDMPDARKVHQAPVPLADLTQRHFFRII